MGQSSYGHLVKRFQDDPELTQFPVVELTRRKRKCAGFIIANNPADVIYLLDGNYLTVQYSTAAALAKTDELMSVQTVIPPYYVKVNRLRGSQPLASPDFS